MVDDGFRIYPSRKAQGHPAEGGKVSINVRFTLELFILINTEAHLRGWSFSQMVRHLCEASIEGIE